MPRSETLQLTPTLPLPDAGKTVLIQSMQPSLVEHYRSVIAEAAGPAPWYLGMAASDFSSPPAKMLWKRNTDNGNTELVNETGDILALVSMYSYVRRISPTSFVVWFKTGSAQAGEVHLQLHQLSCFRPMTLDQISLAKFHKIPFASAAPPQAACSIPVNQETGLRTVQLPPAFIHCPELFVLVASHSTWDNGGLNLWTIDTTRSQMRVTSQDWFNRGAFDFGYQWVTRIARSPDTGKLVGDGIRMGTFLLDNEGSDFLEWLELKV